MPNAKPTPAGKYLHLHFLVFIWGFTAVLGKLIRLDALMLTWYRVGLAVVPLGVLYLLRPSRARYSGRDYLRFALNGALIALHWTAFFGAIKLGNVSSTLVALSSGAFFAALLEPLIYGRRIQKHEVFFGLTVIAGIGLIYGISHIRFWALAAALTAAFLSALFSVWNGLLIQRYPARDLSFFELSSGFVLLSIIVLATGHIPHPAAVRPQDWLWLAVLAWVCTSYTFTVSLDLLRHINPFSLMLAINMEPVYGIILALLVFGESERMRPSFYLGAAVIMAIIVWNTYLKMQGKTKSAS